MVVRDTRRTRNPLRLDVATVDGAGRAYVATQGPAAVDRTEYDALNEYHKTKTSLSRIKAEREKGFPYAVLEKGHCVDIVASEASVAMDKTRILNAICDVDPAKLDEAVPPADHPAFAEVNAALSGLFAEVSLPAAAREKKLETALQILFNDKTRTRVRLDLPCAEISSLSLLAEAFTVWPGLERIELDVSSSGQLRDVSALKGLEQCKNLLFVVLNFRSCAKLGDIADLGRGVGALQGLQHLELVFYGCSALPTMLQKTFRADSKDAFVTAVGM